MSIFCSPSTFFRRRVLDRGQTLFNQGAMHEGIYLIETGRIRVFYTAPSGRAITLAYWHAGNFVGGPEIFGPGVHLWSGVATSNSSVVLLPGKTLRSLVQQVPSLAIGLIEGLTFKGKCYSALAQMLGTRSITERLAHLLLHLVDTYGIKDDKGILIGATFTHADLGGCRSRASSFAGNRRSSFASPTCWRIFAEAANEHFLLTEHVFSAASAEILRSANFWATNRPRAPVSVCGATKAAQR